MISVVKRTGVGCVIMHNADTRDRMHAQIAYADVVEEVFADLRAKIQLAQEAGISKEKLIIDPGIGFAKSRRDDLIMHRRLAELKSLGLPILFCSSRKRFIGDVFGLGKDQRLEGTIASCVIAALHGASIIRVHDVNEVARAIKIADAVRAAV